MGSCLVFTSGKGGAGKSTAVATIGFCLAAMGRRVLCVDLDLRLPNLDLLLGLGDLTVRNVSDVLTGQYSLSDAVIEHPKTQGLFLLAGSAAVYTEIPTQEVLRSLIDEARARYDYCLVDTPSGMDALFSLTANVADAAIVLATSDATSQRDAQRVVMELDEMGMEDIRMIVNRAKLKLIARSSTNVDDMMDFVGVPLLGVVPEDEDVIFAATEAKALALTSKRRAASAFLRIAKRIEGEHVHEVYK